MVFDCRGSPCVVVGFGATVDVAAAVVEIAVGLGTTVNVTGAGTSPITGAGNCAVDTKFSCGIVDSSGAVDFNYEHDVAVDSTGRSWISYSQTNQKVFVAHNMPGSGCTTSAWTCTYVTGSSYDTHSEGVRLSMAIRPDGRPALSVFNTFDNSLMYIENVGSGGDCTSTAWNGCLADVSVTLEDGSSLAYDNNGVPWIAYKDATQGGMVARYVGTGGSVAVLTSVTMSTLKRENSLIPIYATTGTVAPL